jgi:hypothetical protein
LQQDIAARRDERAEIENRHAAERLRLQEEEIARRQAELDGDIAAATCDQNALREQWRTISPTVCREIAPDEMTRQTVAAGRAAWQRLREDKERQVAAAEQWLQTVEEGVATLPDKLAHCANVIAATTTALAGDEHCGDRDGNPAVLFDLLILEEAHQVTESEFAAAARRARRWVLIGEPQLDAEPADAARPVVRPAVLRAGFFERLWNNLHADPHRLPFAWMRRDGRLLCRLRHISADQEKWIETEPVVDRPDIEVRILSVPRQAPRIVEVIFPAGMDLGDAKRFLFHELEELAVQTRGRAMGWSETPDEVILELASSTETESAAISLAGGVCERLTRLPASQNATAKDGIEWHTCSLAFSRADGWTRPSAEDWIAEHLDLRSPGRTILLTAPYRLDPPLARFLSDLLFDGLCQPAKAETTVSLSRPSVEFVAVPTLAALESRSHAESEGRNQAGAAAALSSERGRGGVSVRAPRLRAVKGGAGLELDLADHRPLEPLPSELRALLPRKGLVNYLEACALVKRLEALVADDDFRSVCAHWLQSRRWPCGHDCMSPTACVCPQPNNAPVVAVIALYPAQVQLLRHLLRQSPVLAGTPLALEVGLPSVFQHRECLLALVSLTRSHTHRAVSYGEHPHALAQALTRASSGLILFGDPGTLARRSQWHGPVDHLDESAARREGHVVGQLVHYLQGHGPHPAAFHVQEGSSV